MFLGDLIKKYRTENKISQRDFAKLCNLSHTYIAALEKNIDARTGKPIAPTLDTVKYIANAMNISIEDLLHLLEDQQEFNLKKTAPKFDDIFNKIDLTGFTNEEIELVKKYVEFLKSQRKE